MVSPKQIGPRHKRDWYPYYAGYTEEFAGYVVRKHLGDSAKILDPWSGSGTTTVACLRAGISSVGIDINPALTVIARARLTPRGEAPRLQCIGRTAASSLVAAQDIGHSDPLSAWMQPRSVRFVRQLQATIETEINAIKPEANGLNEASVCLMHTALFATVRDLLARFRTSNPTWMRFPPTPQHRIAPSPGRISGDFERS